VAARMLKLKTGGYKSRLSIAVLHDNIRRSLSNIAQIVAIQQKKSLSSKNPQFLPDFKERCSSLMKFFCATWFWQRIEMQGCLAPHGHVIFATDYNQKLLNDHEHR